MNKKPELKFLFFIIGVIVVVLCGTIFLPYHKYQKIGFQNRKIEAYDDRLEKTLPGNSKILSIDKDSTDLVVRYILKPGFTYPYAGIGIFFNDSGGHYLDCSKFNALKIALASSQQSDCKVYLKVFDAKISNSQDPLSERYLKKDVVLTPVPATLVIPFNRFITPEWWYQRNNITLKDVAPLDLSKVTALLIESGSTAKTGIPDTLTISGLCLINGPTSYAIALLAFLLASISVYTVFRLLPRKKNDPIIITYDKKEVRSYRDIDAQKIADYLAKHYSQPEVSIGTMGGSLGMSQKKIAKLMNDEFKMSFKQYLTSIRIHEAKRLLLETDRLVIDIAFEVGFNSIPHFNRVFKTITHVSPIEFRNKKVVHEDSKPAKPEISY
jgi:AraC-like DNA-binding protein